MGIPHRSIKLPEQGPFEYVWFSVGITLIFRTTAIYSSGALSFHDENQNLSMILNEQVKSECKAAFFFFFCSSYLSLQFLASAVSTAEHL